MNILIVTKNSIIGKGLALELECLGYKAEFGTAFTKGYDIYIADADAFEIESSSNYITFSATEVEFKDFSGIFGEKILEREVLIVQDKKIIRRDSMFFCHSIKLSFVFLNLYKYITKK